MHPQGILQRGYFGLWLNSPIPPSSLPPAIACCHIENYFNPYLEVFAILGLSSFSNLTSQKISQNVPHYVVFL